MISLWKPLWTWAFGMINNSGEIFGIGIARRCGDRYVIWTVPCSIIYINFILYLFTQHLIYINRLNVKQAPRPRASGCGNQFAPPIPPSNPPLSNGPINLFVYTGRIIEDAQGKYLLKVLSHECFHDSLHVAYLCPWPLAPLSFLGRARHMNFVVRRGVNYQ